MQGFSYSTQYYLKFGNYAKCHEQFFITWFTSHIFHTKRLKLDLRLLSISLHFCLLFLLSCQIPVDKLTSGSRLSQWHNHCHITSATVQIGDGRVSHSKYHGSDQSLSISCISHTNHHFLIHDGLVSAHWCRNGHTGTFRLAHLKTPEPQPLSSGHYWALVVHFPKSWTTKLQPLLPKGPLWISVLAVP